MLDQWEIEHLRPDAEVAAGRPKYVFFEGPPTANGRPGIHHVFARTVKDLFCRHRAMRGYYVVRKAGWDTHGLAVEIEVEKKLKITAKAQIEALGIDASTPRAEQRVGVSLRVGATQSAHRVLARLRRSLHHLRSPSTSRVSGGRWRHCGSAICCTTGTRFSPTARGARRRSPVTRSPRATGTSRIRASTWRFPSSDAGRRMLVWTTTPWTLVSNVALAVNPELEYVELLAAAVTIARTLIMAATRAEAVLGSSSGDGVGDGRPFPRHRAGRASLSPPARLGAVPRGAGTTRSSLGNRSCRPRTAAASCICRRHSGPMTTRPANEMACHSYSR